MELLPLWFECRGTRFVKGLAGCGVCHYRPFLVFIIMILMIRRNDVQ